MAPISIILGSIESPRCQLNFAIFVALSTKMSEGENAEKLRESGVGGMAVTTQKNRRQLATTILRCVLQYLEHMIKPLSLQVHD